MNDKDEVLRHLRVHQMELEMRNEELRRVQEELDAARSRYFDLYDLAPVGYCTLGEDGIILEANLTSSALFGLPHDTLAGQPLTRFIFRDDQDAWYLHRKQLFESLAPQSFELRIQKLDGTSFWAGLEASVPRELGKDPICRLVLTDISQTRLVEERLQASLEENKSLLKELQHRAKNSFNMLYSMIGLASGSCDSPEAKGAFDVLATRVRAVSELYTLLSTASSCNELRLDDYCSRIALPLVGMSGNVSLVMDVEGLVVPVKKAAPVGLIVTELVSNAVKYAFPDGQPGKVHLVVKRAGGGCRIEVRDDGAGMPPGFDLAQNREMGLNLVQGLTAQVSGEFRLESGATGTTCILEFPLSEPAPK